MKKLTLILTALAASATLSLAQETTGTAPGGDHGGKGGKGGGGKGANPEEAFKRLDKDSDGKVTLQELKDSPMGQKNPDKVEARFKKLDADGDGKVTLEEFKAGHEGRGGGPGGGAGQKGKGGKKGGGG